MADPLRTDSSGAPDRASDADRDAKIEQLLLVGLDHYFSGDYESAVNVWTRALFFDRGHAKARAYIERARAAMAEQQRESEEILHRGITAFECGNSTEARQLLEEARRRGVSSDEAASLLERLSRLEPAGRQRLVEPQRIGDHSTTLTNLDAVHRAASSPLPWFVAAVITAAAVFVISQSIDWRVAFGRDVRPAAPVEDGQALAPMSSTALPVPRRGEAALERARLHVASGRLHEALAALEAVKPTDPQRSEADQLRARLQRELIGLVSLDAGAAGAPALQREPSR